VVYNTVFVAQLWLRGQHNSPITFSKKLIYGKELPSFLPILTMSRPSLKSGNDALSKLFKGISEHEKGFLVASRGVMRPLISPLLLQLGLTEKTTTSFDLLDGACGTGLLTQEVQDRVPKDVLAKSSFLCSDFSEQMVGIVEKRVEAEGWVNTKTAVLDAKVCRCCHEILVGQTRAD
jgi:hypothetical protein